MTKCLSKGEQNYVIVELERENETEGYRQRGIDKDKKTDRQKEREKEIQRERWREKGRERRGER